MPITPIHRSPISLLPVFVALLAGGCAASAAPARDDGQAMQPYRASGNEPGWLVTLEPGLCTDTMTGMPYPDTATLNFQGRTYQGCGGDPATLLQGDEWTVEEIAGDGVIDGSRVTLNLGADGRISGSAGCNRYSGTFTIGGERVTVGPLAGTRMACAPALNAQEDRFLEVLAGIYGFAVDDGGTLIMRAADGRTLKARR